MNCKVIFDWSRYPFELKSFTIEFEDTPDMPDKRITYLSFGLRPIIIVLSVDSHYSTGIELKLWRFSGMLNVTWWS